MCEWELDRLLIRAPHHHRVGNLAVYGSTKGDWTPGERLCLRGRSCRVSVNAIAPSIAETALTEPFKQRLRFTISCQAHRLQPVEQAAGAIASLASDGASYVTGSTLMVREAWTAIDGPPTG
jgi:NAD(P)-dependent dehydrogenase (short-subunit alcohol dehydrogenase family)